jgi:hypothetical protein
MFSTLFFVLRLSVAWFATLALGIAGFCELFGLFADPVVVLAIFAIAAWVGLDAAAHVQRVRLLTGRGDGEVLSNRQRRELQVPLRGDDAFDELDAAIRALPSLEHVLSVKDSLQVRARLGRIDASDAGRWNPLRWLGATPTRLRAIVMPGPNDSSRVTLSSEPMAGVLADLWFIDDGANVENIEAICRALARRVSERRRALSAKVGEAAPSTASEAVPSVASEAAPSVAGEAAPFAVGEGRPSV